MSKTQWAITVFFMALMGVLAGHVSKPEKVNYSVFSQHYESTANRFRKESNEYITRIDWSISNHDLFPPADSIAHTADSITARCYRMLEQYRQKLLVAAGGMPERMQIPDWKSQQIVKRIFFREKGVDSIVENLHRTLDSLLSFISPYDSARWNTMIRCSVWPRTWNNKANYIALFKNTRIAGAYTSVCLLQCNLQATERLVLKYIFDEYRPSCILRFDTIAAVACPRQRFVTENEVVRADIFFAAFSPRRTNHVTHAETGTIKMYNSVASWTDIAGRPGIYTVRGTDTLTREDGMSIFQWSFSYIVLPHGTATMRIDNMQYCYRDVPQRMSTLHYNDANVSLRAPGAQVRKIEAGMFEVLVTDPALQELTVYTEMKDNHGTVMKTDVARLRVYDLPLPIMTLTGAEDGAISIDALPTARVIASPPDSDIAVTYRVKEYQLSILKKDRHFIGPVVCTDPVVIHNSMLSDIEPGDKLYISDVVAVGPGNKRIEVVGCALVVR